MDTFQHTPILKETITETFLKACLESIRLGHLHDKKIYYVDATLGAGGHAQHFMQAFLNHPLLAGYGLVLIGADRDAQAIDYVQKMLQSPGKFGEQVGHRIEVSLFHCNFKDIFHHIGHRYPGSKIHCFLADLGVSSPQLDQADRGFSLQQDGPVDMRMDTSQELTAAEILLSYSEEELMRLFFDYGEEPRSRKLAKIIVMDRKKGLLPLENTTQLAAYIKRILGYPSSSRTHPATRAFQALRLEVNDELGSLKALLQGLPPRMQPSGVACFISFHSLEDRLVKHAMRNWQRGKNAHDTDSDRVASTIPLHLAVHLPDNSAAGFGKEIPRGGQTPSDTEIIQNPRARSARLRCFVFDRQPEDGSC